MSGIEGKVALVTGGTRGIGYACAETLAHAGARVALCGRTAEKAEAAAGAIGNGARGYAADIADIESAGNLVQSVTDDLGAVQILINNAGITRDGLLMRMKDADWQAVISTNLGGVFHCSKAVLRGMLKARWGRIVNISSIIGLRGQGGQANYAAAKAGVFGFTKSLAQELGSRGVTVNAVAPGYIETDMTAALKEEQRKAIIDGVPLGRVGSPEDVAKAVRFLASDDASYITGAVLQVDGGLAM